jgi:hypothetical protein
MIGIDAHGRRPAARLLALDGHTMRGAYNPTSWAIGPSRIDRTDERLGVGVEQGLTAHEQASSFGRLRRLLHAKAHDETG